MCFSSSLEAAKWGRRAQWNDHPKFPLNYEIGAEDAMMPGMASGFETNANITMAARISRIGNATPAAGDLEGVYLKNPAKPGTSGIDIVIDRTRDK